jgi:multiple sugar transport system permease protein
MAEQAIPAGYAGENVVGGEQVDVAPPKLSPRARVERALFTIPAFLFQFVWGWFPLVTAFLLSFTDARVRGPISFKGLEAYNRMLRDPLLIDAFEVTILYALLSIALTFFIPLIVAILLMEMPQRAMRIMMLLWFLPLSGIANAILWRFMYNTEYGLMSAIARGLGFEDARFLNDPNQVLFWLIFPGIVLFGPGLIYMAALQGIPSSYYEAAEVEGAGFWRKVWTISLPRLRPVITMLLTFAIIGTLQEFTWPQLMTGGGPGASSRTVVLYLYGLWGQLRFADATVVAIFLFALIMGITIVSRIVLREDPDAEPRKLRLPFGARRA